MILLEAQSDINLLWFYMWFFTALLSGFSIITLVKSNLNHQKRNDELSESLYECNDNLNNFNDITKKLNSYEKDIKQIEEARRGRES